MVARGVYGSGISPHCHKPNMNCGGAPDEKLVATPAAEPPVKRFTLCFECAYQVQRKSRDLRIDLSECAAGPVKRNPVTGERWKMSLFSMKNRGDCADSLEAPQRFSR